jgi:hypothetical protein
MRTNTKKFQILKFIGHNPGCRSIDVEKFIICTINDQKWDSKKRAGLWNATLYGIGSSPGLYSQYCTRVDNRWYLNPEATKEISKYADGIRGYTGRGTILAQEEHKPDTIYASGGGTLFSSTSLISPKTGTVASLNGVSPKKILADAFKPAFQAMPQEESVGVILSRSIRILHEARKVLRDKREEFARVTKELGEAKNLEKEAANSLRQALEL